MSVTELAQEAKSVLFVDDEPYVLTALERALRNQGYKILTTVNPKEALKWLSEQTIQIVVADYDMPDMMGHDFLEQVRSSSPQSIRVVLTGASDLQVIQGFILKGKATRYLLKPWDLQELKETLEECFDMYREAQLE